MSFSIFFEQLNINYIIFVLYTISYIIHLEICIDVLKVCRQIQVIIVIIRHEYTNKVSEISHHRMESMKITLKKTKMNFTSNTYKNTEIKMYRLQIKSSLWQIQAIRFRKPYHLNDKLINGFYLPLKNRNICFYYYLKLAGAIVLRKMFLSLHTAGLNIIYKLLDE